MKKQYTIYFVTSVIATMFVVNSSAFAHQQVVVVPLGGAVGNATVSDVVKGKTFSSKVAGKGVTGTLIQHPMGQSYTNSIDMTFNLLPAGTFTMGSPDGSGSEPAELGRLAKETQHEVSLSKSYYMQTTEVTNKQWNTVIFDTGLGSKPAQTHTGDKYPVGKVNWFEAAYFANRLSIIEGRTPCYTLTGCNANVPGADMECDVDVGISETCTGYSLPTSAQWEYAARATTTTAYANPVDFDETETETSSGFNVNLHAMGWYTYNHAMQNSALAAAHEAGSKPVAAKQANRWGLYDMHGNLYEWCRDFSDDTAYSGDPVTDPTGDPTGTKRVYRGGSYPHAASSARSARWAVAIPGSIYSDVGFRLVLSSGLIQQ